MDFLRRILGVYHDAVDSLKSQPQGTSIEFEVHIKHCTKDMFWKVITSALGDKTIKFDGIQQTINFMEPIGDKKRANNIRQMLFVDGKKTESYYRKSQLHSPWNSEESGINYSVHVAQETPIGSFTVPPTAVVRAKKRISFVCCNGQWRIDCTAVKQGTLNLMQPMLTTIRDKFFHKQITKDNYLQLLDPAEVHKYEIELEYIGNSKPYVDGAISTVINLAGVTQVTATGYDTEIIHVARTIYLRMPDFVASFENNPSFKKLGNRVVGLSKNKYIDIYPPVGYYLTEKADGLRGIVSLRDGYMRLIADTLYEFPCDGPPLICDCEYLPKSNALFVFDVMYINDRNVSELGFEKRVDFIQAAVDAINKCGVSSIRENKSDGKPDDKPDDKSDDKSNDKSDDIAAPKITPKIAPKITPKITAHPKKYIRLTTENLESAVKTTYNVVDGSYDIDGLIFTQPGDSYLNTSNYKWKPFENNTIDFFCIKCPSTLLGKKPYIQGSGTTLYILCVGITYDMQRQYNIQLLRELRPIVDKILANASSSTISPIQFCPSMSPMDYLFWSTDATLDGKIVELNKLRDGKWNFVRSRDDRRNERAFYGNFFNVAEDIYHNYFNEFKLEDLYAPKFGYFEKASNMQKNNIYFYPNRYKRMVIDGLVKEYIASGHNNWIVDLASGRGADLKRYITAGVKNALFVDIDANAIAELIQRKMELATQGVREKTSGMATIALVADLSGDPLDLRKRITDLGVPAGNIDAVVCNFAIHYFCNTTDNVKNFLTLVSMLLKPNGIFCFTTMNGAKVFELLTSADSYQTTQDNVIKYNIVRRYRGDTFTRSGQTVSVKLPMANAMQDEPLANIDYIIKTAASLKLELIVENSFNNSKYHIAEDIVNGLTQDDKLYIGLHHYVVLRKKEEPVRRGRKLA